MTDWDQMVDDVGPKGSDDSLAEARGLESLDESELSQERKRRIMAEAALEEASALIKALKGEDG